MSDHWPLLSLQKGPEQVAPTSCHPESLLFDRVLILFDWDPEQG